MYRYAIILHVRVYNEHGPSWVDDVKLPVLMRHHAPDYTHNIINRGDMRTCTQNRAHFHQYKAYIR